MFDHWRDQLRALRKRFDELTTESKLNAHRLDHLSGQVDQLARENRLLLSYLSLPPNEAWQNKSHWVEGAAAETAFPNSTVCRQESFEQTYFAYWARRLCVGLTYHRKVWEHVFICQALWERGVIRPGALGLGFGVGREPLAAFFASQDCEITATDMAPDEAAQAGWRDTSEHAEGLAAVWYPGVCDREQFERQVRFRICDMNYVPDALAGFDFCWSACSLEHLGSIEHGLRFIERSLACLKPGGWAVHTTEFNLSSDTQTVSEGGTVLFRERDMHALAERLSANGHSIAAFDFNPGLDALDRYIDVAPYRAEPHLKLAINGYATTSIGIIIQKAR